MARPLRILVAGGGTGGHVYPAIAIADAVRAQRPDAQIAFAGTEDRLEARAVPDAGYALHPITISGFQRSLSVRNLTFPVRLAKGLMQSWRLVRALDPDVAVGTGGYVAGPVLLAAWLNGCPLLIQEQNAYAGVTNRLLSYLATRIHLAFPEAQAWVPEHKATVTGNPTRPALRSVNAADARDAWGVPPDATAVLVMGGSLGSKALNDALERHHRTLLKDPAVHLLWQTGTRYYDALRKRLRTHPRLHLMKYIDRMDRAYAVADVALCRAGALTCSELLVTGTPAVLVPSPNVVADHQAKNARSMERIGAARVLPEADLETHFVGAVRDLLTDADARERMADAARENARPQAAATIADDVIRLATSPR